MDYFIDNSFTLRRLHTKSGNRSVYSATVTGMPGHIQNLTPEKSQFYEGQIGKVFLGWVPLFELPSRIDAIQQGDQLVDQDGTLYGVQSVAVVAFGSNQHIELVLVKKD